MALVTSRSLALASLLASLAHLHGLAACGGDPAERPRTFGGDRPVELQIPAALDEGKAYPLVVVLHGYSITGFIQEGGLIEFHQHVAGFHFRAVWGQGD